MPLIFALNTAPDPSTHATLERLREQFVAEIGGTHQNPNDPEYARRWRKAQRAIDEQTQAMLGTELNNQLQIRAAQPSPRR